MDADEEPPARLPATDSLRISKLATATHLKDQGNEEFKRKNWKEAMCFYNRAFVVADYILAQGIPPANAGGQQHSPSEETTKVSEEKNYMTEAERGVLSKVYSNRAACWLAVGQHAKAIQDCQDAIRLDPLFSNAHKRLAQAYQESGDFDAAVLVLSRQLAVETANDKTAGRDKPDKTKSNFSAMFTSQKDKDARLTKLGSKVPEFKERVNFVKRLQTKLGLGKEMIRAGDARSAIAQFREVGVSGGV